MSQTAAQILESIELIWVNEGKKPWNEMPLSLLRKAEQARIQFEEAAEHGYGNALYNLGYMYHRGNFMAPDYYKAKGYYEEAIRKGHTKVTVPVAVLSSLVIMSIGVDCG